LKVLTSKLRLLRASRLAALASARAALARARLSEDSVDHFAAAHPE
jgi:hypothetical protein